MLQLFSLVLVIVIFLSYLAFSNPSENGNLIVLVTSHCNVALLYFCQHKTRLSSFFKLYLNIHFFSSLDVVFEYTLYEPFRSLMCLPELPSDAFFFFLMCIFDSFLNHVVWNFDLFKYYFILLGLKYVEVH